MKKKLFIAVIPLILLLIYYTAFGEGPQNYRNFKKLKISMHKTEVLKLMGPPDHIIYNDEANFEIYLYKPPMFFVSDQIEVIMSNNNKEVVKLNNPK